MLAGLPDRARFPAPIWQRRSCPNWQPCMLVLHTEREDRSLARVFEIQTGKVQGSIPQ